MKFPIYLDYSATTPVDPRVAQKMIPYLTEHFGNAASRSHAYGWESEKAVEEAREHVAALLNADPREIVWTSGATEGNNLAIKGAANFYKSKGRHIITSTIEHHAVLHTCRDLEKQGWSITWLPVSSDGLINPEDVRRAIRPNGETVLITIMHANNEIGTIQPVAEIGAVCRKAARRRAEGDESELVVTPDVVTELLGAPRFLDEEVLRAEGIEDLAPYAVEPGGPLQDDLFV